MKAELEGLVQSLEAFITAAEQAEAERLEAIYQSRIDESLLRHPGLSRDQLLRMVDFKHRLWLTANKKFSSIPPKA